MTECLHVSRDGFLLYLLDGWRLPFVVEPAMGTKGLIA